MKTKFTQDQYKCKAQDSKRMYFYYLKMAKNNDSKFIQIYIKEWKKDYDKAISMINDINWVLKYGTLNYFQGKILK